MGKTGKTLSGEGGGVSSATVNGGSGNRRTRQRCSPVPSPMVMSPPCAMKRGMIRCIGEPLYVSFLPVADSPVPRQSSEAAVQNHAGGFRKRNDC